MAVTKHRFRLQAPLLLLALLLPAASWADAWTEAEHGYAQNGDVRIHYATMGEGPLVVMIHGFPDFWYSWRHQMEGLKDDFKVVAIDQRGYNRSDQPEGQASYNMRNLVADVAAVIQHLGEDSATIVGHDWGGSVAWQFAFALPADGRQPDHTEPASSEWHQQGAAIERGAAGEQRLRTHVHRRIAH